MTGFLLKLTNRFYGPRLEFRVRLLNIITTVGAAVGVAAAVSSRFTGSGTALTRLYLLGAALAVGVFIYVTLTGNYRAGSMVVIGTFFGLFTTMFFKAGGMEGGIPFFFVFAVVSTVLMLKGKLRLFFCALELAVYVALYIYAYYSGGAGIRYIDNDVSRLFHIMACFIIAIISIGVMLSLHIRLYDRQQRELEDARRKAEAYARLKSELVAEMSHELRTPLAVMSGYAQYAVEQIRRKGISERTLTELESVSSEARRLAELADNTLDILKVSNYTDSGGNPKNTPVDIGATAEKIIALQKPIVERIGLELRSNIEDNLPHISGNAGELTQIIWNIVQNAVLHSGGDIVTVCVCRDDKSDKDGKGDGGGIIIAVEDDGDGIPAELLPKVFERGVSGIEGRSGLGLPVSQEIARRHGGDIAVTTEYGKGTRVVVLLPVASGF